MIVNFVEYSIPCLLSHLIQFNFSEYSSGAPDKKGV